MAEVRVKKERFLDNNKTRHHLGQTLTEISSDFSFEDAHVELLTPPRINDLVEFMNAHFDPDETLAKAVGLKIDMDVKHSYRKRLMQDNQFSIILVSNITNEIIAFLTIYVKKKDNKFDLNGMKNTGLKQIYTFMESCDGVDVFQKYQADRVISFDDLATHKDHRRKGIARQMLQIGIEFSKEFDIIPCIINVEGTSNVSQAIFEQLGFDHIGTFRYDEFEVNGNKVFGDTGIHETMKVYIKEI